MWNGASRYCAESSWSSWWKMLSIISTNHSNGFPEPSVCLCVCVCLCVTKSIDEWNTIALSGLAFISLPCLVKETKTLLSFCWRQKGLGAMTHWANSRLSGATGPSLSICDWPLPVVFCRFHTLSTAPPLFFTLFSFFWHAKDHQLTIPAQSQVQQNITELVPTFYHTDFKLVFWARGNTETVTKL